jgi:hypothetical protein
VENKRKHIARLHNERKRKRRQEVILGARGKVVMVGL